MELLQGSKNVYEVCESITWGGQCRFGAEVERRSIKSAGAEGSYRNNKVAHMRALFNFAIKKNYSRKRTRLMALWLARALNVKTLSDSQLETVYRVMQQQREGSNPAIVIVMHWLQHGSGLPCWISCAIRPYARISSYISELAMSILIRTAFTYGLRG